MFAVIDYIVIAAALGYAGWALVAVVRDQPPREPYVVGAGVVEALVLIQVLIAFVTMAVEGSPAETATFVGYLLMIPLVLPLGVFWALAEKSRWGTSVLVVATLVLPVLVIRLEQIWEST